jgi:hypothetical protein
MAYGTPLALFADRADADIPHTELFSACYEWLAGREQQVSKDTIRKYRETFTSFTKSLVLHN